MKKILFLLCAALIALISCNSSSVENDYKEALLLRNNRQYDEAFNILAHISMNPDATWQQRSNALFNMSLIEDVVNKDRVAAIEYINRAIKVAAPNESALLYAYKGDYSMHYGVLDTAVHYCRKALSIPHDNTVEYVSHYTLFHAYEQKGMADSAAYHKALFEKACDNGKLSAYSELSDELFNQKLQDKIEKSKKEESPTLILYLVIVAIAVLLIFLYQKNRRGKGNDDIVGEPSDDFEGKLLCGEQAFEKGAVAQVLNELRIKEKELYKSTFADGELLEKEIFQSFAEANTVLIGKYNLSADELLCCDYSYIGISNNVIAYVTHSTPAAIRKRKERLKHKLSTSHYSAIFEK